MYLTVDLVSALNKSNSADQHVEIKYKVFAGKDGERFVKFYLITKYICSFGKCIFGHYNTIFLFNVSVY